MLIVDNTTLDLDDTISDNFTKHIYPITPEECKKLCGNHVWYAFFKCY